MNNRKIFLDTPLLHPLTCDELYNYFKKMEFGDTEARDKIINHNIGFVIDLVVRKYSNTPYDLDELISIGLNSLVDSVDTFNINGKIQFEIYLESSIYFAISRFINKEKNHLNNISLETIKNEDNISIDSISNFTLEQKNIVKKIIEELPKRDKNIIIKYFGFIDKPITQQEIAKELGVSHQNISKIIKRILRNIKDELEDNELINYKHEDKQNKQRKIKSIYELFNMYPREKINEMLSLLSDEEKKLIILRYGEDLDNPITSEKWDSKNRYQYYNILLPKMKLILSEETKGIIDYSLENLNQKKKSN